MCLLETGRLALGSPITGERQDLVPGIAGRVSSAAGRAPAPRTALGMILLRGPASRLLWGTAPREAWPEPGPEPYCRGPPPTQADLGQLSRMDPRRLAGPAKSGALPPGGTALTPLRGGSLRCGSIGCRPTTGTTPTIGNTLQQRRCETAGVVSS